MSAAWGLDVGRRAIKACRVRGVKEQLELDAVVTIDLEIGGGPEDAAMEEAQRAAVTKLVNSQQITDPVLVAIPGHVTFSKVIRVNATDRQKLAANMRFEAQQNIPFPLSDVVWDYHVLGQGEGEFEVSLYAAKRDQVARMLKWMGDAGLDVAGVQIAPIALTNFARHDLDLRGTNVLLDIGSDNTDLIVSDGDRTWIRNMPIAGNSVTEALQEQFKCSFGEAETLKIKAGDSRDAQKILQVMQPVLEDLATEVARSIDYYRKSVPDTKFEKLLLLGNGMRLVGLREAIAAAVDIPVVKLVRLSAVQYGPGLSMDSVREQLPGLGVALGLALQGCEIAPIPVNLLPEDTQLERELSRKRPWYAAAALSAIVAVLALWGLAASDRGAVNASLSKSQTVIDEYNEAAKSFHELSDTQALRDAVTAAGALGGDRDRWLPLWQAIAAAVPSDNTAVAPGADMGRVWLLDVNTGWTAGSPTMKGTDAAHSQVAWNLTAAVTFKVRKGNEGDVAKGREDSALWVDGKVLPNFQLPELGGIAMITKSWGTDSLDPDAPETAADAKPRFWRFTITGSLPNAAPRDGGSAGESR